MADNFNLTGFLKKNQLLNENIGGYVDIKPVKEEMGTAMGEADMAGGGMSAIERSLDHRELAQLSRELNKFAEAAMDIAQFLDDAGFDQGDIKQFLIDKLNGMILA